MTFPYFGIRIGLLSAAFALAQASAGSAAQPSPLDPCSFLTSQEAATLLGGSAGSAEAQHGAQSCVFATHAAPDDRVTLTVSQFAPENAPRLERHLDEERGDELPSLHGEPWWEQGVIDPAHPLDRTFTIVRDRTNLTLTLHSSVQKDAVKAFKQVWVAIAERLPTDEQP